MTYYFIADLHLNENQPEITNLFLQFMQEKASLAQAVYILGDLFDFWIGDDEESELINSVKAAIKTLTASGVKCYFICGNRDFLVGKRFSQETGMEILPDYQVIDLFGISTLLCHGDTLCIDDVKYQQFRRKVHQKWRQWLFLCLPLAWRIRIAEKIRAKSKLDKKSKPADIMDVNPEFTAQTVVQFKTTHLIHGHTHRQAVHNENGFVRIVLGDWKTNYASILEVTQQGFKFV